MITVLVAAVFLLALDVFACRQEIPARLLDLTPMIKKKRP